MQAEPEFIPAKLAAERICRSYIWLSQIRKRPGEGPPFYKIGGKYFYRPTEIMAWLRSRRGS